MCHKHRMAAVRLVCASPSSNPAVARLAKTFPSLLKYGAPDSQPELCTHLPPKTLPPYWMTDHPKLNVRSHLAVDNLANRVHPLLASFSSAPLTATALLPQNPLLPSPDTIVAAYQALRGHTRQLLLKEGRKLAPPLHITPSPCH